MNDPVLFNITPPGEIFSNATAIQIDISPFYTVELILWLIFATTLLWFFLWLYFKFRGRMQ